VAASTQNQALNALVFLYKAVLERPLQEIGGVVRAKKPQKLPVVLSPEEVKGVLRHLQGTHWLVGCLLYGSGLRLMEAVRLRVKDLDFDHRAILGDFCQKTYQPAWLFARLLRFDNSYRAPLCACCRSLKTNENPAHPGIFFPAIA
jgi:hypothetical protein